MQCVVSVCVIDSLMMSRSECVILYNVYILYYAVYFIFVCFKCHIPFSALFFEMSDLYHNLYYMLYCFGNLPVF